MGPAIGVSNSSVSNEKLPLNTDINDTLTSYRVNLDIK